MPYRFEQPKSPWLKALPLLICGVWALGLWMARPPKPRPLLEGGLDAETTACLSNLSQIALAFSLYARDYDGKIPRGVDPEDRHNPTIWRDSGPSNFGGAFYDDATRTPYLHEVLRPYVKSPRLFHCPADVGWTKSHLSMLSQSTLQNIKPSSYAKFGTSYYVLTKFGFAELRADDIENPSEALLLFDGDLWHVNNNQELLNGLFADGHAANLTSKQFDAYSRQ